MRCSDDYECKLLIYFNEVVYVDKNTYIIETKEVYKENNKVKYKLFKKQIELIELIINEKTTDLIQPECTDYALLNLIRKKSKQVNFKNYSKGIFKRYKHRKDLNDYLSNLNSSECYLITDSLIYSKIKSKTNLEIKIVDCLDELGNKILDNKIIIFNKSSKVYLNKEVCVTEIDSILSIHCGVDKEDFITINLS